MRRLILLITALATLASPAIAASDCKSEADQSLYDVLALREQMSVYVNKCTGHEQEYNKNFIIRFQPALQANDRAVLAYFRRVYGGAGQGRMDSFVTDLVSEMSHRANLQGTEYCGRAAWIISEMNGLTSMDQLAAYAGTKNVAPADLSMCPTVAAASTRSSGTRPHRH